MALRDLPASPVTSEGRAPSSPPLSAIADALPVLIAFVDPQERYTYANAAYERWFGLRRDQVVGHPVREVLGEEAYAQVRPALHQAFAGQPSVVEDRVRYRHGGERWVRYEYLPHAEGNGRVAGAIVIARDILPQKRAEEERERFRADLQDFVDNATVGLHWVGPDGTILWANRAELELLGYAPEEYIGQPIEKFHADPPIIVDILDRLRRGETLHSYEARMRAKDGSVKHVLISSNVRFDGDRFLHTRCFTRDITERKLAEEALRSSEARLRVRERQQATVAALGQQALVGGDVQALLQAATEHLAKVLDVEYCKVLQLLPGGHELLLRAGVGWKPGLVGHGRVGTGKDSQAGFTLATHGPVIVDDLRTESRFSGPPLLREHGVISGMSVVIGGPEGRPWGVLGAHATRHVRFTADDTNFLSSVAHVLGAALERQRVEDDLRAANERLRDLDRKKSDFINLVAHELRTPLTPVMMRLQILRSSGLSPDQARSLDVLDRNLERLNRLVQQLLDVARLENGRLALRRSPLDFRRVVEDAVDTFQEAAKLTGVELRAEVSGNLRLEADAERLLQVLVNLLSNALKFTGPGGRIVLRAQGDGEGVRVEVEDTGAGFEPAHEAALFTRFGQPHGFDRGGSGLGLFISKALVEEHQGRIWGRSDGAGKGARFGFWVPRRDGTSTPLVEPA